jgi:hypothetical protein
MAAAPDDPRRPGSLGTGRRALPPRASTCCSTTRPCASWSRTARRIAGRRTRRQAKCASPSTPCWSPSAASPTSRATAWRNRRRHRRARSTPTSSCRPATPTSTPAGDVAGPYQFTHTAAHQAWYAAVNALFDPFKKFKADYSVIPWATFVEPEVARVGLNEPKPRRKGIAHEVSRYDIDDLDRAIADSEAHGFIKVLTVPGKDRILGVTIVGEHAGDLIAEYVLAMKHGIGLNKILGTIHIYPTWPRPTSTSPASGRSAHAPEGLLAWVARFHAWRRGDDMKLARLLLGLVFAWQPPGLGARPSTTRTRPGARAAGEARQDLQQRQCQRRRLRRRSRPSMRR